MVTFQQIVLTENLEQFEWNIHQKFQILISVMVAGESSSCIVSTT